ncbi:NAD-dependent epimerase/dehydratase family protein [Pontivivens insulae]|uniref:GDP-L-fucose synthase n=1 Tax=Pontivivens insulae TaxID=1639689 RepID=A0A2R8A7E6_9RHOB|nr:NAD-dependent epimerase/dehydratase family protein [Pontivivens insulae]RED18259.1 nucleoside-diphosphate-sugar epimerase [Pontivivens insulae]SPF28157.1 GDP-L-fucose synthase [Pontivivens insulae]
MVTELLASPRVLITGITGEFGRVLRFGQKINPIAGDVIYHGRRIKQIDGHIVRAIDLSASEAEWRTWFSKTKPQTILHLAGVTYTSGLGREEMVALNADAAVKVARAASDAGVERFLYASTAGVYGPQPDDISTLKEGRPTRPGSDYATSKAIGEEKILAFAQTTDMQMSVLRYATTAGSDMLVRNALMATRDVPLQLDQFADNSTPERSYLGPSDLASIHWKLLAADGIDIPNILNIATPGSVQMHQLLGALPAVLERKIAWTYRDAGQNAVRRNVLDCTLLERTLRQKLPLTDPIRLSDQIKAFLDADLKSA